MRFDKPMGVNRLHPRLSRFTNRILPRDEHEPRRGDPQVKHRIEDICNKAERDPQDGSISIPEDNQLLRGVIFYVAGKYTLEEMMETAAGEKGVPVETIKWMLDRFGEINPSAVSVDAMIGFAERVDMSPGEREELGAELSRLLENNSDAAIVAALSPAEMYYAAALRKMKREKK